MSTEKLQPFNAISYRTADGENCIAQKQNGVVTIKGDKHGVRQVPLDKFMQELGQTLPQVNLERTPAKDTVAFSGNAEATDTKKTKGKLIALGAVVLAVGTYLLTRGKSGKNVSKAITEAAEAGGKKASTVAQTAVKATDEVATTIASVADDVVPVAGKNARKAKRQAVSIIPNEQPQIVPTVTKKSQKATQQVTESVVKETPAVAPAIAAAKPAEEVVETVVKNKNVSGLADDAIGCGKHSCGQNLDDVIQSRKGTYGQDLDDALDPLNWDDIMSPHYRPKGAYGQYLDDALDPRNLDDAASIYYNPNTYSQADDFLDPLNLSSPLNPINMMDDFGSSGFGF